MVIADLAMFRGVPLDTVGAVYFAVADRLRLDWLRDRIGDLPRADRWQTEARAALRDDLTDLHRALTEDVLASTDAAAPPAARVERWMETHGAAVSRYLGVVVDVEAGGVYDLATLGAVRRELRDLCGAHAPR
jgi:glutamate dehydrogenase